MFPFLVSNLQERVKSRIISIKELATASTVPVDAVVNLFKTDTGASSGSKLLERSRLGKGVILVIHV